MTFIETIYNFLSGLTPEKIIQFLIDPQFSGWLLVIKIIFIVLSLIFLAFIIFALVKTKWLKRVITWDLQEFLSYRPFVMRRTEKEWRKIKARLETEMESENKLAIIEADKMLDGLLSQMGSGGKDLNEKLEKLTAESLPNIEEVKWVHKIRNNIIHDPTYKLSIEEAKKALLVYEKALTDLHAL
ncbi:MAG TPA: DUF4145 domain-containing protein [Candidatus Humimicrobiaceae bacterium]|nr:DUF4145 domain-containing protein [Candidatus Humimicrobiaceae bacterium]